MMILSAMAMIITINDDTISYDNDYNDVSAMAMIIMMILSKMTMIIMMILSAMALIIMINDDTISYDNDYNDDTISCGNDYND